MQPGESRVTTGQSAGGVALDVVGVMWLLESCKVVAGRKLG